ncbi:DUF2391 family protein [Halorhabdus amylolytica]|uniref:DUF2391 family protein n=1 Tax=Halorhabdus amylolytica TaxID=2559573 RepID=UPI0010AAD1D3|nr:DUF2391 family protein [Halorhabdus amylolytica]
MARRNRYQLADTAQQVVGGFLLAGPFVVTEEVWMLASEMTRWHAVATAVLVAVIGYGALYQADDDRDPDTEAEVVGLPVRFLSLLGVAFGSVAVLALLLNAPASFLGAESTATQVATTLKVVSVGAIFSVVGAATADSIF